jgi:hypothetical protein
VIVVIAGPPLITLLIYAMVEGKNTFAIASVHHVLDLYFSVFNRIF